MAKIRAFIALPISPEIREEIASLQAQLIAADAAVKWDAHEKFHITLKFLGDIESSQVDAIGGALKKSIGASPSFEIAYVTLGSFPNVDRPRVVWIGAQENEHIHSLQRLVEEACLSLGFAKEEHPFHAHITLGRVKGSRNLDRLTARLKSITFQPLMARCTEVRLMRSELKPTGSVYTLLNSIPLAS